jgi:hypothetical protein
MRQAASAKEAVKAGWAPMRRELGSMGAGAVAAAPPSPDCRALEMHRMTICLRLILIRLTDDSFVDDLCLHFRRSGFTAQRAGGSMIEVSRSDAPSPEQARREIELHLTVWRATNPGVGAELVG